MENKLIYGLCIICICILLFILFAPMFEVSVYSKDDGHLIMRDRINLIQAGRFKIVFYNNTNFSLFNNECIVGE